MFSWRGDDVESTLNTRDKKPGHVDIPQGVRSTPCNPENELFDVMSMYYKAAKGPTICWQLLPFSKMSLLYTAPVRISSGRYYVRVSSAAKKETQLTFHNPESPSCTFLRKKRIYQTFFFFLVRPSSGKRGIGTSAQETRKWDTHSSNTTSLLSWQFSIANNCQIDNTKKKKKERVKNPMKRMKFCTFFSLQMFPTAL